VNRNKKSVAVDFKTDKGRKILRDLIDTSDIVVENYIPGTLKKYGLDYETLRDTSKRGKELIYASITGELC
jgi:succinate--hydroxymethylglutarate CoA-transferase